LLSFYRSLLTFLFFFVLLHFSTIVVLFSGVV
jgi:hypothetical protein